MMRLALFFALCLSACAGDPHDMRGPHLKPAADPGMVIATEIAFNQLAQAKGQWTAFRAMAAPDAEMFVPQRVRALDWLKGKADPAVSVKWQPFQVWSSCDGSVAVTHGAWQGPKASGYFTTVWTRQVDGSYRWMLDHGDALAMPLTAPEMIAAHVAECSGSPGVSIAAPGVGTDMKQGIARDQTLQWTSSVSPDGSRVVLIRLWNGTVHETVLEEHVAAEK